MSGFFGGNFRIDTDPSCAGPRAFDLPVDWDWLHPFLETLSEKDTTRERSELLVPLRARSRSRCFKYRLDNCGRPVSRYLRLRQRCNNISKLGGGPSLGE